MGYDNWQFAVEIGGVGQSLIENLTRFTPNYSSVRFVFNASGVLDLPLPRTLDLGFVVGLDERAIATEIDPPTTNCASSKKISPDAQCN
jgi:hypothetical protein